MKMEHTHVKLVLGAGMPKLPIPDQDKRRVYTTSVIIPRPLMRRASIDGSSLMRGRGLTFQRADSLIESPDRRHSFGNTTARETSLRKKRSAPPAQTVTTVPTCALPSPISEVKSILKSRNGTYVCKVAEDTASVETSEDRSSTDAGTDVKFCYRLPGKEKAPTKLRKSVSFRDDQLYGTQKGYTRQFSSPMFSLPSKGYPHARRENTLHITNF